MPNALLEGTHHSGSLAKEPDREIGKLLVFGDVAQGDLWQDNKDVPRDELVERVMEVTWIGFERLMEGEEWSPTE